MPRSSKKRIYLDYAASTPASAEVLRAMMPYFAKNFANPSSLHVPGQEALHALDNAREDVANALHADFREVIFTASATEANNLALRGVAERAKELGIERPRIIVSQIEHESILETARDLEHKGIEVVYLAVTHDGVVDLEVLEKLLNERTVLVSIMYANNEIGVTQPIAEIGKIVRTFRGIGAYPLLHTDAVQAFQFLECNVEKLGVDLLTLSGHKLYGPKGVGALYRKGDKQEKNLTAVITGGGQEFGLRSGTENVPVIIGFAEAVRGIEKSRKTNVKKILGLKLMFWKDLKKMFPKAELNGGGDVKNESTLPNILNVYLPGYSAADLLVSFDRVGIAVSAGSACSMRSLEPSYVIQALGHSKERAGSSIRFSFGTPTTGDEVKEVLARIRTLFPHKK